MSKPTPFTPKNHDFLLGHLAGANEHAAKFRPYIDAPATTKATLARLEAAFLTDPTETAGEACAAAAVMHREAVALASVIENAGGPDALRRRFLSNPDTYADLADAYAERMARVSGSLEAVRDALGLRAASLVREGKHPALIVSDPHGLRLNEAVRVHERDLEACTLAARKCRAADYSQTVEQHLSIITSPLPTFPVLPSLTPELARA